MTEERRNDQNSSAQNASTSKFNGPLKDRLQGKKSNAKRIGVKSVLSYGDRSLAITQFGRGNSADIVFNAPNGGRDEKVPDQYGNFTIQQIDKNIDILGGMNHEVLESMLHNPAEDVAEDKLKLKGTLEQEFFGQKFPGSNVHIQLIHNILDIQKILGLYINDVVYAIDNLQTSGKKNDEFNREQSTSDAMGGKVSDDTVSKLRAYMPFFGDVFNISKRKKDAGARAYNLNVLRTVTALRHWTAHYGISDFNNRDMNDAYPFFNNSKTGNDFLSGTEGDWSVVEKNYTDKIDRINKSFLDNSIKNVLALYKYLNLGDAEQKKALVEDYYNFSIVKTGKNLGVSIVNLREKMIDKFYPKIKENVCDNHRSKIYTLTDYMIYRYLNENPELVKNGIRLLQNTVNEEQKAKVYEGLAEELWSAMKEQLERFFSDSCVNKPDYVTSCNETKELPLEYVDTIKVAIFNKFKVDDLGRGLKSRNIPSSSIAKIYLKKSLSDFVDGFNFTDNVPYELFNSIRIKDDIPDAVIEQIKKSGEVPLQWIENVTVKVAIQPKWIDQVKISSDNGVPFVMLLSFMCNFLEGKEINELLTAYIHKFENIQSFIDLLIELGQPVTFTQPYSAFNSMDNQFAKEAARQLRILASIGKMKPDLTEAKKPLYIAAVKTLGATDDQVSDEFIEKYILADRTNKKEYIKQKGKVNPFRNFIANNVIESRRFQYLVRYSKPETVRTLMNNSKIVRYTLSRLPEKQIDSYYERTSDARKNAKYEEKLNALTDVVTGLTFQTVMDNNGNIISNPKRKPPVVERLKAQINLYLTVAYVAIKQLVKINARYFIAFQILERDTELTLRKTAGDLKPLSNYFRPCKYKDANGKDVEDIIKHFVLIEYFMAIDDERYDEIKQWKPKDEQWKPADKKAWFEHVRRVKKEQHLNNEWRLRFHRDIEESLDVSKTGYLPVSVRNLTAHLYILSLIEDYVGQFRKNTKEPMQSYFELYHFLLQSRLLQEKGLDLRMFCKDIQNGIPDDRLVKVAYVPFAYNFARYKNLTVDALFDEDGAAGKAHIEELYRKQSWGDVKSAKRKGLSNEVVEQMVDNYIAQFGSDNEARKAVHKGAVLHCEDKARIAGEKGISFPQEIIQYMETEKLTDEEIAQIHRVYDAAKRKSEN